MIAPSLPRLQRITSRSQGDEDPRERIVGARVALRLGHVEWRLPEINEVPTPPFSSSGVLPHAVWQVSCPAGGDKQYNKVRPASGGRGGPRADPVWGRGGVGT